MSSRTPNDILLHKTVHSSIKKKRQDTPTKLKNLFINGKERDELMDACCQGDINKVQQLLKSTKPTLNPNLIRDSKLRSPLLIACAAGRADLVRLLISYGSDVNNPVGDIIGNRPLDLAVISNDVETVLVLLEAGAKVYIPSSSSVNNNDRVPIRERARARSPIDLAQSRLNLLIKQSDELSFNNPAFVSQVLQIIDLLKKFTQSSIPSIQDDLNDLTNRLSAFDIHQQDMIRTNDVIKDLGDIISKLQI
ncbi:unnamed protein product [Cunninghamella blakesleeana]